MPLFVKDDFGTFYRDMFARQVERENRRAVFLEYAWNMAWCDPCAADPLSRDELRELGVFWLDGTASRGGAQQVFLTRLHVRYDAWSFPEDLVFQETGNTRNFQGRYIIRHAFQGGDDCREIQRYRRGLQQRWEREAATLANLTGWEIATIRDRMRQDGVWIETARDEPWWKRIWKN